MKKLIALITLALITFASHGQTMAQKREARKATETKRLIENPNNSNDSLMTAADHLEKAATLSSWGLGLTLTSTIWLLPAIADPEMALPLTVLAGTQVIIGIALNFSGWSQIKKSSQKLTYESYMMEKRMKALENSK
jgi:hypothetical protein